MAGDRFDFKCFQNYKVQRLVYIIKAEKFKIELDGIQEKNKNRRN